MSCRAAPPRRLPGRAIMLVHASVIAILFFECAVAFVPVGIRVPFGSIQDRGLDRLVASQRTRLAYRGATRFGSIRMSPDMLQAESEGSVEPLELKGPPTLSGPPVRPAAPAPEEKPAPPQAASAPAPAPAAAAPAVSKPEVWEYSDAFSWVKDATGVTPSDVLITQCGKCRAQYALDAAQLGEDGKKVQCAVCGNQWFQSPSKLEQLPEGTEFKQYPADDYKQHARQVQERRGGGGGGRGGGGGKVTLFVGNLPFSLTEDTLRNVFSPYGTVLSANIICDQETGKPRGFGFVDFSSDEAAQEAIKYVNGMNVEGRQLAVNLSEDRGRGGGGGRGRGGRGGRGRGGMRGRSDGRDADGKFIIRKRGE